MHHLDIEPIERIIESSSTKLKRKNPNEILCCSLPETFDEYVGGKSSSILLITKFVIQNNIL